MLVGALTYFDLIFVLTGGGPGDATRVLSLDMYMTGFSANDMGARASSPSSSSWPGSCWPGPSPS